MDKYWDNFDDGADVDTVISYYDQHRGENYQHIKSVYGGPRILAECVTSYLDKMADVQRILDVGAGSGFLGKEMSGLNARIRNSEITLDALEPSNGMAANARKLHLYHQFYSQLITGIGSTDIPADHYDCVVSSGAFMPSHIPAEGLLEILRVLRTGGIFAVIMREANMLRHPYYEDKLVPLLNALEDSGVAQKLHFETKIKGYYGEFDGAMFVYKKLKNNGFE